MMFLHEARARVPLVQKHHQHKCDVFDNAFLLALALEHARATGQALAGLSIDRAKFFDMIQFRLGHELMLRLGAHTGVVNAATKLYAALGCAALGCRYKIGHAFSEVFQRDRGFFQGDSYSVQVALALMSRWTAYVETRSCEASVLRTGSFIDDSYTFAQGFRCSQIARAVVGSWVHSLEYDRLSDLDQPSQELVFLQLKLSRLLCLKPLPLSTPGLAFNSKTPLVFRLTGSIRTISGHPDLTHRNDAVDRAMRKLRRIRYAPVCFDARMRMAADAAIPTCMFGTHLQSLTLAQSEMLPGRVVSAAWKGHHWCRCSATMFTLVVHGHRVHPRMAAVY